MRATHSLCCAVLATFGATLSAGVEWGETDGVLKKTFYSPPLTLHVGQYTMREHIPIPFLTSPSMVVKIDTDFVDLAGKSVPLTQAYMHHWLMTNSDLSRQNTLGSFGAGSEFRGAAEGFEKPFGMPTTGKETWSVTLHVLDLRATPPHLILPSLECRRHDDCSTGPCLDPHGQMGALSSTPWFGNYPGGLVACSSGAFNYTKFGYPVPKLPDVTYRLKYDVTYIPMSPDLAAVSVPITFARLQTEAPNFEYHIPVCDDGDDMCVNVKTSEWTVRGPMIRCTSCLTTQQFEATVGSPVANDDALESALPSASGENGIVWALGHQHDGGLGIQLWMRLPYEADFKLVCASAPAYGTETGQAGNDEGFVVGQNPCRFGEPIATPDGAVLQIRSIYDAHAPRYDLAPFYKPSGQQYAHTGVMGYMRLRFVDIAKYNSRTIGKGNIDSAALAGLIMNLHLTPAQLVALKAGLDSEASAKAKPMALPGV